ncbi:MAG: glycosyltransferase family 39 protein [Sulfurimonas sp.]|uniref:ArnT family glycosyltransferase n=1 Tax=Sulfurimonas sp. TaxID=2022749 RepID=UPI002632D8FB|nr:glycosyltransferase family 39 protein [Sulfurimonas sp.]MCW8894445.1 glycosyltransferase family 39 protein [Sulfurimonas sp.]MCW8954061.1 glycosyltransferase family 39 protein [Sulfurimonas sp.]
MREYYKKEVNILIAIFLFKIVILSLLPLTGDEAYFIKWADNLNQGYYDHPPMVGWLIYLMSYVNDSHIFFRMFPIATTFVVAWVIYKIALLYKVRPSKAYYTALVFLASPVDLLLALMTNDIALLLFSSLGTMFLLYSLEKKEWFRYALLAGIFLGAAFLSKYFAVFLMFSLLIFSFYMYKRKATKTVVVVTLLILLFVAQNLYFNYNSCWNNIMFNFFARTENNAYNYKTVLGYFGMIIYIFTPWGLYYLFKTQFTKRKPLKRLLVSILAVAFLLFFIVSLKNKIGLHWFLLFTPYMFLLFTFVHEKSLNKLFKYNAIFTFIHIAILMSILLIPTSLLENHKKYSDIVMYTQPEEVCKELDKLSDDRIFTSSYSTAAVLSHHCNKDLTVLFSTSKYGRMDDKLLDVRTLSDKNIIFFNKKPINERELKQVCGSFKVKKTEIAKADFYIATCKKFDYEKYKTFYLDVQKEKFYNIPDWLPVGECYFNDRYYNDDESK